MKSQDILMLLKILSKADANWRQLDLANELFISPSEVAMGLERSRVSGLIDPSKKKVLKSSFLEFIIYGLRYVYPAQLGVITRGVPTAHSAPPLSNKIVSSSEVTDIYVWPDANGSVKGQSVEPLYPSVVQAVKIDSKLYEYLSLIDALRVGRAREKNLAIQELEKRFK